MYKSERFKTKMVQWYNRNSDFNITMRFKYIQISCSNFTYPQPVRQMTDGGLSEEKNIIKQ